MMSPHTVRGRYRCRGPQVEALREALDDADE